MFFFQIIQSFWFPFTDLQGHGVPPLHEMHSSGLGRQKCLGTNPIKLLRPQSGNTKGGSITVPLTSCLTGLESAV